MEDEAIHDVECPTVRIPENYPGGFTAFEQEQLDGLHVPVSKNEFQRIEALRHVNILDNIFLEEAFQSLTSLASRVFKVVRLKVLVR